MTAANRRPPMRERWIIDGMSGREVEAQVGTPTDTPRPLQKRDTHALVHSLGRRPLSQIGTSPIAPTDQRLIPPPGLGRWGSIRISCRVQQFGACFRSSASLIGTLVMFAATGRTTATTPATAASPSFLGADQRSAKPEFCPASPSLGKFAAGNMNRPLHGILDTGQNGSSIRSRNARGIAVNIRRNGASGLDPTVTLHHFGPTCTADHPIRGPAEECGLTTAYMMSDQPAE